MTRKHNHLSLFYLFSIIILNFNCTNEPPAPASNPPQVCQISSLTMDGEKYLIEDSRLTQIEGKGYTISFVYDNKGRVIERNSDILSDDIFYYYNEDDQIVKTIWQDYDSLFTRYYYKTNGELEKSIRIYVSMNPWKNEIDTSFWETTFEFSNGNLVKTANYSYQSYNKTKIFFDSVRYEYDDNINPLTLIQNTDPIPNNINNIIKTEYSERHEVLNSTIQYEYNDERFPKRSIKSQDGDMFTMLYDYQYYCK